MGRYLDKIRRQQPKLDWLAEWRHLASMTHGIGPNDTRLPAILCALDQCDTAFLSGDVAAFRVAVKQVEEAVKGR